MKTQLHSTAAPSHLNHTTAHLFARGACLWAALGLFAVQAFVARPAQAAVTQAWAQRYNGPANDGDQAQAVAVDGNGNVVVTGYSYNTNFNYDYYTAKYAATNGALLWEQRYDSANDYDYASGVALDGNGNVVVTGYSYNGTQDVFYTAKYAAANGALLWEKPSPVAFTAGHASAIVVDGGGNVAVTGSLDGGRSIDYYTVKYAAANGALLWEKRYNFPDPEGRSSDNATSVAVDGSGDVVVTGNSVGDYYTAKYGAANGALLWEKRYSGPSGEDQATAVAVDGNGNVVVTGNSYGTTLNYDYYTAKYAAANGALLWEKRYNGPPANQDDLAQAVAVDGNGNVVVTGYSYNGDPTIAGNADFYTAKYAAANGALLWEKRYNGPANRDDLAQAVAVDGSGNVVVTGRSMNSSGNDDYYTAKYAAANGVLLWEKRYNGPANGNDFVATSHSLALGPNGMVAITGYSDGIFNSHTTSDYATIVYRENLPPVSIAADGTGGYFIRGTGSAGTIYQLQRATTVTGPWISNATMTAVSPGLIEFHDTNASSGRAFYRTAQP